MKNFTFKGLMAPVFTAYHNDQEKAVNLEIIEHYAKYLKQTGIDAVLVNGTSGEGMLMNVLERKQETEAWKQACDTHNIVLMVQIGGAPYPDVIELAEHAEKLQVDGVLCLPELYFKPRTPENLTNYLKNVALHCPSVAFFYYHIPLFTDVNVHMPTFLDMAEQSIPNFCGIKYTSNDLDQGSGCLKEGRTIFLGADRILCGAVATGFNSFIMTTLNICPELSKEIIQCAQSGNIQKAQQIQIQLNSRISEILKHGDWVTAMKKAFNESCNLNLGKTRAPLSFE